MTWWPTWMARILLLCRPSRSSARSGDRRAAAASALRALILRMCGDHVGDAVERCSREPIAVVEPQDARHFASAPLWSSDTDHTRDSGADEAVSLTTGQHPPHPTGIPSAVALSPFVCSECHFRARVSDWIIGPTGPECLRAPATRRYRVNAAGHSSPRPAMLGAFSFCSLPRHRGIATSSRIMRTALIDDAQQLGGSGANLHNELPIGNSARQFALHSAVAACLRDAIEGDDTCWRAGSLGQVDDAAALTPMSTALNFHSTTVAVLAKRDPTAE